MLRLISVHLLVTWTAELSAVSVPNVLFLWATKAKQNGGRAYGFLWRKGKVQVLRRMFGPLLELKTWHLFEHQSQTTAIIITIIITSSDSVSYARAA